MAPPVCTAVAADLPYKYCPPCPTPQTLDLSDPARPSSATLTELHQPARHLAIPSPHPQSRHVFKYRHPAPVCHHHRLLPLCVEAHSQLPGFRTAGQSQSLSPLARAAQGGGLFKECTDGEFTVAYNTRVYNKCGKCKPSGLDCPPACCTHKLTTDSGSSANQHFMCAADGCKFEMRDSTRTRIRQRPALRMYTIFSIDPALVVEMHLHRRQQAKLLLKGNVLPNIRFFIVCPTNQLSPSSPMSVLLEQVVSDFLAPTLTEVKLPSLVKSLLRRHRS
jgi:hypothetical protein